MYAELVIKNYRCFPDSHPATIQIRPGFTAFVGVNNSGKSSLLRFFYELRALFDMLTNPDVWVFLARGGVQTFSPAASVHDNAEIFSEKTDRNIELEFRFIDGTSYSPPLPGRVVIRVSRGSNQFTMQVSRSDGRLLPAHQSAQRENVTLLVFDPQGERIELAPVIDICKKLSRTLYIGPFRNAINVGSNQSYFDIQVGEAFVQRWKQYKTGTTKAENLAAYRVSDEIGHIFGFKRLEINASEDTKALQVFIDGSPYRLHEVGSGLTQFILVLVNAAIRRPAFILIDEPELNLHPSLQLDFLTTLTSYAEDGVYFATHSYGLARASAEQVYAVSRLSQGVSDMRPLESVNRLSEFLGELSFAGYRDMGFEKILLVEGPTEVKTVQQFLRLLHIDHKVVLLPLGGNSMINDKRATELEELKRISPKVFGLIDSERAADGAALDSARAGFVQACKAADIHCHVLQRRATENYLSERAIKAVKGDKYRALSPFEDRRAVNPVWSKEENWRIAREMSLQELAGTDLYDFLNSLV